MTTITYPITQLTIGITGSTGTTITPTSITTPLLLVNNIVDSTGSTGQNGNVLSSTTDGIRWIGISGTTGSSGITGNLDMNTTYDITNAGTIDCINLNTTTINAPTFTNQIAFTSAPSCAVGPTAANHIVNKNYVDTTPTYTVYNLYLNQSQITTVQLVSGSTGTTGYSKLSDLVTSTVQTTPLSTTANAVATFPIISFISDPIGITQIPSCILNVNIYGNITTAGSRIYYNSTFRLYNNTTKNITTLGNTGRSSFILNNTAGYPLMYTMQISVPSTPTNLTDRFILEISATSTVAGSYPINTYFENKFYSYIQIQSNTAILFQSTNNYIANTATSDLNMNNFNITSTGNLNISCPNKILSLGNKSSTINIEKQTSGNIYLGSTGSTINLNKPLNINYITRNLYTGLGSNITISATGLPTTFPIGTTSSVQGTVVLNYSGIWFFSFQCGADSFTTIPNGFSVFVYKTSVIPSNYICSKKYVMKSFANANSITLDSNGIIDVKNNSITLIFVLTLNKASAADGRPTFNSPEFIRIG